MSDENEELKAPPSPVRDQALWVGFFLIVGIVGTLGVLFTMTDAALFRGRYIVSTTVPDAGGIRRGDPVQMRGVNIGRVMGFTIDAKGVAIRLEIEGEYPVPTDSKVQLKSAGLLGGMVAEILPGSASQRLRYGDTVAGSSEESTMSATQRIMDQATNSINRVDKLLSDDMIKDVHGTTSELASLTKSLSETIKEQREELKSLEASLKKNSDGVQRVTNGPELDRAMKRLDEISARAEKVATSLDTSAKAVESMMGRIDRGEGTLGKLSKDDELYKNLNDTVKSINQASAEMTKLIEEMKKNPKKFFKFSVF
jgi:phospholipid/cholesterol/gamma-HCH transport system substrate-binding protein